MSNIFDYEGSLRRMGDDEALFQEMALLLRSDAPTLLTELQAAHKAGDASRMQRAAHTLKGLAANFGAGRAVAAAAEMEQLAKARQTAGMPAAIVEIEESLEELIGVLAHYCETSPSY
jgi:HPt (histidine-containing phosphotransfer) domain-containing protein